MEELHRDEVNKMLRKPDRAVKIVKCSLEMATRLSLSVTRRIVFRRVTSHS